MKLRRIRKYILFTLLIGFMGSSAAAPYPSPGGIFGEDIDGNGLFFPEDPVLSIELFDLGEFLDPLLLGFEFGFYYANDPGTLIPIFDELDVSALSVPFGVPQLALIDFSVGPVGAVFDVDNPVPGSTTPFITQGTDPIGFYLEYPSVPEPNGPIFTQEALNPGGLDLAAVYPIIGEPGAFGIGFVLPLDGGSPPSLLPLAGYAVGPVSPVPLPGALGFWLLGLGGLAAFRRWVRARGRIATAQPALA